MPAKAPNTHQARVAGMQETIRALEEAGIRNEVRVLVGGAPVSQKFADEIGADGYAEHAAEAVDKIKDLL